MNTIDLPARVADWLLQLATAQRFVAYIVVDAAQALAEAGGDLGHYGLEGLRCGTPAPGQLPVLEGLLPLPETPFLVPSVNMPGGRVADVHLFEADGATWGVLVDVTPEHDQAQARQQKAYDMTLLNQREARLMAKLRAAHEDLQAAHRDLAESQDALLRTHRRLQRELRDAERYVRAILPPPMTAPFEVDWRFVPSTELGGDSFGYHWIDAEHFAIYLLDVCGHGVGPSLLSVAVTNTLRAGALGPIDVRRPEEVLGALNRAYQMDDHDGLYFTIWYGVYHHPTSRLTYASAGHPAPMLVSGPRGQRGRATPLSQTGLLLGMLPSTVYESAELVLVPPARLFVFSDGAYEIRRPDDTFVPLASFEETITRAMPDDRSELDDVLRFAQEARGGLLLEDDFSIIKMTI